MKETAYNFEIIKVTVKVQLLKYLVSDQISKN